MTTLIKKWTGTEWADANVKIWSYDSEAETYNWLGARALRYTSDGLWVGDASGTLDLSSTIISGVTTNSARVGVEIPFSNIARVIVADDTDDVATSPEFNLDGFGLGWVEVTGLSPYTDYEYRVETKVNAIDPWTAVGTPKTFRTRHPLGAVVAMQKFVVTGCSANHEDVNQWADLEAFDPDFHIGIGDQNYSDEGSTDPNAHIHWWEQLGRVPGMRRVYGNIATEQILSDHDGGGVGNAIDKPAIMANYLSWEARFPHMPYPAGTPVGARYRSFDSGRICFILLDTRSYQRKSGGGGVGESDTTAALGDKQMEWLNALFNRADYGTNIQAFVLVTDFVTHDKQPGGGKLTGKPDSWSNYPASRTAVTNMMSGKNCVVIAGDNHGLFGDEGTHNPLGFVPMIGCAGIERNSGNERGESNWDYYFPAQGLEDVPIRVYGRFTIEDTGDEITITMIGRDAESHTDKFTIITTFEV
jgi:hypothetical protein